MTARRQKFQRGDYHSAGLHSSALLGVLFCSHFVTAIASGSARRVHRALSESVPPPTSKSLNQSHSAARGIPPSWLRGGSPGAAGAGEGEGGGGGGGGKPHHDHGGGSTVPRTAAKAAAAAAETSLLLVRWCCVGSAECNYCKATVPALTSTELNQRWSCVARGSKEECMDAIGEGEAELLNLDAGLAFRAFSNKRMKAIVAERLEYGEAYDAVAVVRKELCSDKPSGKAAAGSAPGGKRETSQQGAALWAQIPQLGSCHPFYASSAGWDLPNLLLQSLHFTSSNGSSQSPDSTPGPGGKQASEPQGQYHQQAVGQSHSSLVGYPPDAQLLGSMFGKSCAPSTAAASTANQHSTEAQDDHSGGRQSQHEEQLHQQLCSGCTSPEGTGSCDLDDPYSGFAGAFRCLMESAGDVAFTRSSVPLRFSQGGHLAQSWSTLPASEFRYLCPPPIGGCIDIVDNPAALNCTLGRIPANVIMTRNAISEQDKRRIIARLESAGTVPRWRTALYEAGGNPYDYVLTSSARGLVQVSVLSRKYLGDSGIAASRVQSFNFAKDSSAGASTKSASTRITKLSSAFVSLYLMFLIVFACSMSEQV